MKTHAEAKKTDAGTAVQREPAARRDGGKAALPLTSGRPDASRWQAMADASPRTTQLKGLQDTADDSPQAERARQRQTVARTENHHGLPRNLKAGIENLSGMDMSDVTVHRNSSRPAQLQARAYAQGTAIHLAPGQDAHLPHEAWHVVQQKQGRVRPTRQIGSVGINDAPTLEGEADTMGAQALRTRPEAPAITVARERRDAPAVQRITDFSKWFINIVMPTVLAYVKEIDFETYISTVFEYLAIDDAEDDDWAVAEGFLFTVFANLIPDNALENGLEALAAIRRQLTAGKPESGISPESVMQVTARIQDLEQSYRSAIDSRAEVHEDVLRETRDYAVSQKRQRRQAPKTYPDVLASGAAELLMRPSSTSHHLETREFLPLSHGDQGDASKYHRSAKHWLFTGKMRGATAKKPASGKTAPKKPVIADMVARQGAIKPGSKGNGAEAHVGLYPNSFSYLRNLDDSVKKPEDEARAPEHTTPATGDLYDQALAYKRMLSQRVADGSPGLAYLDVGVYNDYPLVMVHFDLAAFVNDYGKSIAKPTDGTRKAFTSFLMNYYMGLANYYARSAGLDITIVERSSFGFNTPSIAQTAESFRINMGLMPPLYAEVHIRALKFLNAQLAHLMKKKAARVAADHPLKTTDKYFAGKGNAVDALDDWLAFAMYKIESKGKTSIANAVRTRTSLDYVNARSFNLLAAGGGRIATLGTVMAGLFKAMRIKTGAKANSLSTEVDVSQTRYRSDVVGSPAEHTVSPQAVDQYDQLLALVRHGLLEIALASTDREFRERAVALAPLLHAGNRHIELTLDLVNELLLIHAMHRVGETTDSRELADGYGSESEYEDSSDDEQQDAGMDLDDAAHDKSPREGRPLTGKKIITHNGMRALLSSIDSSVKVIYEDKRTLNVHVQGAYYEMTDALKASTIKAQVTTKKSNADVLVRDINACVTVGRKGRTDIMGDLLSSPAKVWIIDTTSSDQRQMRGLVDAFRAQAKVQVLYLVSSGFKQEQFGGDRNPYGTIRAFADKGERGRGMVDQILATTKATDRPLADTAHVYRQVMKRFGAVPSNANLLKRSRGSDPFPGSASGHERGVDDEDRHGKTGKDDDWSEDDEEQDHGWALFNAGATDAPTLARDAALKTLQSMLEVVPAQEDDVNADQADHSRHASEFIHTGMDSGTSSASKEKSAARKEWFHVIGNPGGGDCLFHALAGKTLEFAQIVEWRESLAAAAGNVMKGDTVSGSQIYLSLMQSGFLARDMRRAIDRKHQVPTGVYQQSIKVPGLYAGEEELRIVCTLHDQPKEIYVVTAQGELRKVTAGGVQTVGLVAVLGADPFRQAVQELLSGGAKVLFKTADHWEQITAVV